MKTLLLFLVLLIASAQTQAHFVKLMWADTANPSGTTYNVYKLTGGCPATAPTLGNIGSFTKLNTAPIIAMLYQDSSVTSGGSYCYFATAVSGASESAPSGTIASGTIPVAFPPGGMILVIQ